MFHDWNYQNAAGGETQQVHEWFQMTLLWCALSPKESFSETYHPDRHV